MTSEPHGGYRGAAWLAALGACALGIAGYSGSEGVAAAGVPPAADAGSRVAEQRLGGCSTVERVTFDPFGPTTILDRADRWVEVSGAAALPALPALPAGTVLPADKTAALDWAARSGARAFLALGGDRVAALLLRHRDGTYFFAGHCAGRALTEPLRRDLGDRYDAVLTRLVAGPRPGRPPMRSQ